MNTSTNVTEYLYQYWTGVVLSIIDKFVEHERRQGGGGVALSGFSHISPSGFLTSFRFVKTTQLSPTIVVLCCAG